MAKDYKTRTDKPKSRQTNWSLVFTFITGLIIGLAATIIFYLQSQGPHPKKKPQDEIIVDKPDTAAETSISELSKTEEKNKDTDLLDYEFHKILPNREINISEWETTEEETPIVETPEDESITYILQVGSFKDISAADEVKAKLAILGIIANIQRVVINGQDIRHRVRIGPFSDTERLQNTKKKLENNRFDFMLLKLKVEG